MTKIDSYPQKTAAAGDLVLGIDVSDATDDPAGSTSLFSAEMLGELATLQKAEVLANLTVLDDALTAPPGSPSAGDLYIVGASATGAWAGQDLDIAVYRSAAWAFYTPGEGWRAYEKTSNELLIFNGTAWAAFSGGGGGGDVAVDDEGVEILAAATRFDFQGAGVAVTDGGSNVAVITVSGGGGGAPAQGFRATMSTNQTEIASAFEKIEFDTVEFDTEGEYVTGTFRWVVPASLNGAMMNAGVNIRTTTDPEDYVVYISHMNSGGTSLAGAQQSIEASQQASLVLGAVQVSTGDYFDCTVFAKTGLTIDASSVANNFWGYVVPGGGAAFKHTIAISDESTDLAAAVAKVTFRMPAAVTLSEVRASVNTAPVGSTIIVDINEGGTSILSTKLSIDASEKTSTTALTAAVISDTALADDAEITIDIDQIGSTTAGKGLKVTLIGFYT